jgi:hypothetical protein
MKKNLQDIDFIFNQSLKDYEEEPPEYTWQEIENHLNRKDAEQYRARYQSLQKTFICAMFVCASLVAGDIIQFSINNPVRYKVDKFSSVDKKNLKKINPDNNGANSPFAKKSKTENFADNLKGTNATKARDYNDNSSFIDPLNYHNRIKDVLIASVRSKASVTGSVDLPAFIAPNALNKGISFNNIENQSTALLKQNRVKRKHVFYIIPFFSLDHITGRLQEQYEYDDQDASDYTKREKPDVSYTMGFLSEYGLSEKLSVQSGFLLSNSFTSVSSTVVRALQDNSGSYKFKLATTYGLAEIKKAGIPQNGDSILINSAMQVLQYISVPVLVKVNFKKQGKFNITGTTGLALNRILHDKVEVDYKSPTISEIETVTKIEGLKNTFFTFVAGAEASYSLNRRINIGINPMIRYAITPINKGTPIKTYLVSTGIGATVRFKL